MEQLVPHQAELDRLRTRVAVISFAENPYWGRVWVEQTGVPFPLLIDTDRRAYIDYGLERSFWGSWGPETLLFYTKAILQGRRLHGIKGDSEQMGGDFIVDRTGIVRYVYRSQSAVDRPPISDLFEVLEAITPP